MIFKKLITGLLILVASICQSQSIKLEHYNDKNGLSHNSVRHIVQDKYGFLWLGTFSGLNRFDGYQFKTFLSESTGINNDDITALELDDEANNLWIGTRNGLTLYKTDLHKFITYLPDKSKANSLPDAEIRSIFIDPLKRVWVGTKTKGVFLFYPKENRFEKIKIEGFNYVKEIFQDKKGNIWIGSYRSGSVAKVSLTPSGAISRIDRFTLSIPNSSKKNPYINFIFEDQKSDIFVGTRKGLYKLNKTNYTFECIEIEDKGLSDNLGPFFLSIAQGPRGKYWLGTFGGIIVCDQLEDIKIGNFKRYYSVLSDNNSLVDNLISALYFDSSGVLWIGTEDGLDKYDPFENQFNLNLDISKYIGNQLPRIRGFTKSIDNKVVVATRHNGLFISEGEHFKPLFRTSEDIASIYSSDGIVFYCGLWNGKILVFNYLKRISKVIDVGFKESPVFSSKSIGENRILLSSFGEGAVQLNTKTLKRDTNFKTVLKGTQINTSLTDSAGNIWFATETGVKKYKKSTGIIKSYTTNSGSGLPHDNVSYITIDKDGKLWAATRLGLAIFNEQLDVFQPLTSPKELAGKWIIAMVTDPNGDLWLNLNNNNVARLKIDNQDYNVYHVNSGNRLDVFSTSGFFSFDNSNIYLGSKRGIIHFSPYTINENSWSPNPLITEFRVQNKEVHPGVEINGQIPLKEDINKVKSIDLSYDNRNFSLQFSAPSFTNEDLNTFKYKLEGFDENWVDAKSNSRRVQYTNLFPGEYTFKLKSSNSNGYWSEEVAYKINVKPPFWLTWQALLFVLLITALVFYLVRREVKNRVRLKQELVTEKVNRERDIKLNNDKLRFFTNISHELRTPLTLILGPVKQLIDGEKASNDYQRSRYRLIDQNATRLLNLVNQVLDFRKAQTGELNLKVSKTDLLKHTKNTFDFFKELAYNKNIVLSFNSDESQMVGWIDRDKYDKILYNLLSNAIKFTNQHGHVDLFIQFKDNNKSQLLVEVSDDGIGIPFKSQKKIFNRFYQAANSKENNTGSGIGLALVKSLVNLHRGEISVKSEPDQGCFFTLTIPVERSFYSQSEIFDFQNFTAPKAIPQAKKVLQNTEIKDKVLVIEDNAELRSYLSDYLSDFYKVYVSENGEEGLKMCKKIKPILCIVDVMMPVMDGLEFCEKLKSDEFISHIPVVLLTSLAESEDKVKGYNVGADGYLAKPFDPTLLKTIIGNVIKTRLELKSRFSGEVESEVSLLTNSPLDEALMVKVTKLITDNLDFEHLTISFLCTELGMSSSHLYRKIKELTDLAPNEFIRTIRLKKSAALLKSKKYNVSEVTNLVGFNDPLYFSRCFKKQFGFPPSKLLK